MKASLQETTDSFQDCLGRKFRPGDTIAVAVGGGKSSANLLIGIVQRINTTTQKGEEILETVNGKRVRSCSVTVLTVYQGRNVGVQKTFSGRHRMVLIERKGWSDDEVVDVRSELIEIMEDIAV